MTAIAFQLPTADEERDELASLTGLLAQPTSDTLLDAVASDGLRVMADCDAEITRYRKALEAEMQRIYARYALLIEPHEKLRAQAEGIVQECARRAQFVGKAKSRKVGNGQYGKKTVPERVSIVDKAKALEFARAVCPLAVKEKTEESVVHSIVAGYVVEHLHATGEIPEGFEHVGEHEDFYAKPLAAEASQ